jgi:ABC-type cobalt transport system substrate-binding protein
VPLRLEPLQNLNNMALKRSTETEVYNQIVKDLTEAINSGKLPDDYPAASKGRATVHAARALLADVYLTTEKWSEAASTAQTIINSGKFKLEPDMSKMFRPEDGSTHSGEIWSIKWARKTGLGAYFLTFMHNPSPKYSSVGYFTYIGILQCPVIANWNDNDKRKKLNLYDTDKSTPEGAGLSTSVPMLFKKFIDSNPAGDEGHGNDWPMYRYEDALLIYAEAKCMADNNPGTEAYDAVNKIRRRAYGVDINTPAPGIDLSGLSKDAFREAVWDERAHEFIMEAKRWYDLKRMGKTIAEQKIRASGATKATGWGPEDWYWPIPRQEIDNNDPMSFS